ERQLVALDRADGAVETARGEDLVALGDVLEQRLLRDLSPLLRPDHEQPHHREDRDDDDQKACAACSRCDYVQAASSGPPARRSSASRLKSASRPASTAARAPAVSSSRKCRLCSDSSRSASTSCWLTRCRMYPRENRVHAGHAQRSS